MACRFAAPRLRAEYRCSATNHQPEHYRRRPYRQRPWIHDCLNSSTDRPPSALPTTHCNSKPANPVLPRLRTRTVIVTDCRLAIPITARKRACAAGSDGPSLARSRGYPAASHPQNRLAPGLKQYLTAVQIGGRPQYHSLLLVGRRRMIGAVLRSKPQAAKPPRHSRNNSQSSDPDQTQDASVFWLK